MAVTFVTNEDMACTSHSYTLDTTYVTSSGTKIFVRRSGNVVTVRPYVTMNSSASSTNTLYQIATGLPAPVEAWYGTILERDTSLGHTLVISTDGTMSIQVSKASAINGKLLRGCVTYLTNA